MPEDEIVCRVKWLGLWKSISIYGTLSVSFAVFAVFAIRLYKLDFDIEKTFEHVTFLGLLSIPFIIAIGISVLFLPIALMCSMATITIKN